MNRYIAISVNSFEHSGCIQCGCDSVYNSCGISSVGTTPVKCRECGTEFVLLANGITKSTLGFGNPAVYPKLHEHPRIGVPKHKYSKPETIFKKSDVSEFVNSQEGGKHLLKIFSEIISSEKKNKSGTYCFVLEDGVTIFVNYSGNDPNWMQLKIGYYPDYREDISSLLKLTSNGIITKVILLDDNGTIGLESTTDDKNKSSSIVACM